MNQQNEQKNPVRENYIFEEGIIFYNKQQLKKLIDNVNDENALFYAYQSSIKVTNVEPKRALEQLKALEIGTNENKVKESKLEFIEEMKRRLSSCSQEDALFPLAGQDYRNQIIEMLDYVRGELSNQ